MNKAKIQYWGKQEIHAFWIYVVIILAMLIGISVSVCFYEGKALAYDYREAMGIWENHLNNQNIRGTVGKDNGVMSSNAEAFVPTEELPGKSQAVPAVSQIVDRIYTLESSNGLNDDKCERLGKHNGYGYSQWNGHNTCFGSDDETRGYVINWFNEKLQQKTLAEAVCLYNTGTANESCEYFQRFASL